MADTPTKIQCHRKPNRHNFYPWVSFAAFDKLSYLELWGRAPPKKMASWSREKIHDYFQHMTTKNQYLGIPFPHDY